MDEYLLIEGKVSGLNETIEKLGCPYTTIQSKMTYYLIHAPNEKLKGLYDSGVKLVARIPEIPSRFSEFKEKFTESLDSLLKKEELPHVSATRYVPMCSSCPPISQSALNKRDSLLEKIHKGFLTVKNKTTLTGASNE